MEISTASFLLLQTVFALLQTPFYSLLFCPKTSPSFEKQCLLVFADTVLRIFNRSCLPPYAMTIVLLSRGKHKLPKQLIDIRHHYNPPLSTALCHYNTSSSKGPKFSVNPVLCWNIFFSFSFIPQWPPLLRIKINASFWRNNPVSGLEPKYWCKGITGWH